MTSRTSGRRTNCRTRSIICSILSFRRKPMGLRYAVYSLLAPKTNQSKSLVGIGSHHHQKRQVLVARVANTMIHARRSQHCGSLPQDLLLLANLEGAAAFQDVVDLICTMMAMRVLCLARQETIDVTE